MPQTRTIGVSNYCPSTFECLLEKATVVPAVNQVQYHIGMGTDLSEVVFRDISWVPDAKVTYTPVSWTSVESSAHVDRGGGAGVVSSTVSLLSRKYSTS